MFYSNLKNICDKKGVKITPLVLECGGTKGIIGGWKKGTSPNSDIVMKIAIKLNVSTDVLLFGEERSNNTNISNSNIVDHSNGTITINSSSVSKESKAENVSEQAVINETTKELIEVFESLPTRERVRLLNMVYDFEEQYQKFNQSTPQKEKSPTFNAQSKWRIATHTIDGTYESRPATPEEIEKLKLLEDAPEPEY